MKICLRLRPTKLFQRNKFMDEIFAALIIILGIRAIFTPSSFYKIELLTPEKISRNNRILKRMGIAQVILGIALATILIFWK